MAGLLFRQPNHLRRKSAGIERELQNEIGARFPRRLWSRSRRKGHHPVTAISDRGESAERVGAGRAAPPYDEHQGRDPLSRGPLELGHVVAALNFEPNIAKEQRDHPGESLLRHQ